MLQGGIGSTGLRRTLGWILLFALVPFSFASFEDLEIGPRATGMGGAFVAQRDDATVLFYNPASLTSLRRLDLVLAHESMYTGLTDGSSLSRQVIALATPLRKGQWGSLGLGYNPFTLSGFYKEAAMRLAYAKKFGDRLSIGLGLSMLSVSYPANEFTPLNPVFQTGNSKSATSLDLGALYARKAYRVGLAILNLNEPDVGIVHPNPVERRILAGFALDRGRWNWNLSVGKVGGDTKFKTGVEARFLRNRAVLRSGLGLGSRDFKNVAFGLGWQGGAYRIDYSLKLPMGALSGLMSHQFGVGLRWGAPIAEEAAEDLEGDRWTELAEETMDEMLERMMERMDEKFEEVVAAQKGSTGPVASMPVLTELTPAQLKMERKLLSEVNRDLSKGRFGKALGRLRTAQEVLKRRPEIQKMTAKLEPIVQVFGIRTLGGRGQRSYLLKMGMIAYLKEDGRTAVDALNHAHERWPKDRAVTQLYQFISEQLPGHVAALGRIPGVTLIEQRLQEALELMYEAKYLGAIVKCQDVLRLQPNNLLAQKRMGSAYWALEYGEVAKSIWRKALKKHPKDRELLEYLRFRPEKAGRAKEQARKLTSKEYERGVAFYKKLKNSGASPEVLKGALKRMVRKFKGTGIDTSYIEKEYKRLGP